MNRSALQGCSGGSGEMDRPPFVTRLCVYAFSGFLSCIPRCKMGFVRYLVPGEGKVMRKTILALLALATSVLLPAVAWATPPIVDGGENQVMYPGDQLVLHGTASDPIDGDEIIESPPMTDTFGDFVLDAEAEFFCLAPSFSGGMLMYAKWDTRINRYFRITVNRTSGVANVILVGGPYGGGGIKQVQRKMGRYARGLSDLDVSTFLNNPSWESAGTIINPTGVAELGAVRITFQVDRVEKSGPEYLESVQTIKFRPRN